MFKEVNKVVPHLELYIGSLRGVRDIKVTHIINLSCADYDAPGTQIYQININDSVDEDISQYFDHTSKYIHNVLNSGGSVLVHCLAGISRSASIVIAYLMFRDGWSAFAARQILRTSRPIINPNPRFWVDLINYRPLTAEDSPTSIKSPVM